MVSNAVFIGLGLAAGLVLQWGVLWAVRRPTLLAEPNERSSHTTPTPTMGGIAVVLVMLGYFAWLATVDFTLGLTFAVPLLALGVVGLLDDLWALSARFRMAVQLLAAAGVLYGLQQSAPGMQMPMILQAVLLIGMVWFINLYNFMDGIDGIAGVQCLMYCIGAQWVSVGIPGWSGDVLWLLGGAVCAFLAFNWPPAKIFMGDVGSGFLGLLIAALAIVLWQAGELPLVASLILLSGFWFDATYTLCVRMVTGQKFTQAHRSHLYQHAAQRIGHLWTTVIFAVYAAIWLIPWAGFSVGASPALQGAALAAAIIPLAILCWRFGAGLPASGSVRS